MANSSLQEDVYDAFQEGRWIPHTEGTQNDDGDWVVTVKDNHGQSVSHTDSSMSEAHNRAMDKVRDAIQKGKFSP
jgi:hypothetical protein